jgi:hypothetical protein
MKTIRMIFVAFLATGATASAQDAPPPPTGADWSDAIRDVFLPAASASSLRTETDIAARWLELPQAERETVKADCAASRMKDDSTEADQPPPPTEDDAQASEQGGGQDDAGGVISLTQVVQICRVVDGLM